MDLGSACQGGQRETSPHDTWTLISEPFDLGLFGSLLLVPKQRAVTSTGAYVLMDLGSVEP
mgnify:CR=1 FL=1